MDRPSIGAIFPLQTMNERHHTASFLLVIALGLCLYLPLLTRNYDINGLMEAAAVESGNPVNLWNPNHMLYRPVGYFIRQTLAVAGIHTGVIPFLQVLSAIFGALGLGFVFLALEHLTSNRTIAIWMSLALGVSWSYWTLSTDVYYFSMAAMLVAASLAIFVRSESVSSLMACGLLAGLSILACQANVVLLPGLGIAVLLRNPSQPDPEIHPGNVVDLDFRRCRRWNCFRGSCHSGLSAAHHSRDSRMGDQLLRNPASHVGHVVAAQPAAADCWQRFQECACHGLLDVPVFPETPEERRTAFMDCAAGIHLHGRHSHRGIPKERVRFEQQESYRFSGC